MGFFSKKSEEQKYLDKLDEKERSERTALDDGGYKFSLSTGLQKRSRSEQDEDAYLAEQGNKDRTELAIHKKAITRKNMQDVGKSASEAALSGVKAVGRGMQSGIQYAGSSQIAQYAGSRAKGALSYIPEKFETARLDFEAGKISKKTYESAYRQHKIDTAEARGSSSEQRKYREKIRKETDTIDRERARKDIAISAEKAYYTAKARSAGRQAGIIATQQQFAIQQQQQRPRKQWAAPVYMKNPYRQPTAQELDPLNIFTLRPYNQTPPTNTQQVSTNNQKIDMSYLNSLLGFNPPSQQSQSKTHKSQANKPKRKKFNIFTAQYEWV